MDLDAAFFSEYSALLARGGTTAKAATPQLAVTSKQVKPFRSGHRFGALNG